MLSSTWLEPYNWKVFLVTFQKWIRRHVVNMNPL